MATTSGKIQPSVHLGITTLWGGVCSYQHLLPWVTRDGANSDTASLTPSCSCQPHTSIMKKGRSTLGNPHLLLFPTYLGTNRSGSYTLGRKCPTRACNPSIISEVECAKSSPCPQKIWKLPVCVQRASVYPAMWPQLGDSETNYLERYQEVRKSSQENSK